MDATAVDCSATHQVIVVVAAAETMEKPHCSANHHVETSSCLDTNQEEEVVVLVGNEEEEEEEASGSCSGCSKVQVGVGEEGINVVDRSGSGSQQEGDSSVVEGIDADDCSSTQVVSETEGIDEAHYSSQHQIVEGVGNDGRSVANQVVVEGNGEAGCSGTDQVVGEGMNRIGCLDTHLGMDIVGCLDTHQETEFISKDKQQEEESEEEEDPIEEPIEKPIIYPIDDLLVQPADDDPVFTDRPPPSRNFTIQMDCVGDLLMVWDFCTAFSSLLHLKIVPFEDFQNSICCHNDNKLSIIIESLRAILHLLIRDEGKYFKAIMKKDRKGKIRHESWKKYLCDFLEMEDSPELSTYVEIIRCGKYGLLDTHVKLAIFRELVNEALATNLVRQMWDSDIEEGHELTAINRETTALEKGSETETCNGALRSTEDKELADNSLATNVVKEPLDTDIEQRHELTATKREVVQETEMGTETCNALRPTEDKDLVKQALVSNVVRDQFGTDVEERCEHTATKEIITVEEGTEIFIETCNKTLKLSEDQEVVNQTRSTNFVREQVDTNIEQGHKPTDTKREVIVVEEGAQMDVETCNEVLRLTEDDKLFNQALPTNVIGEQFDTNPEQRYEHKATPKDVIVVEEVIEMDNETCNTTLRSTENKELANQALATNVVRAELETDTEQRHKFTAKTREIIAVEKGSETGSNTCIMVQTPREKKELINQALETNVVREQLETDTEQRHEHAATKEIVVVEEVIKMDTETCNMTLRPTDEKELVNQALATQVDGEQLETDKLTTKKRKIIEVEEDTEIVTKTCNKALRATEDNRVVNQAQATNVVMEQLNTVTEQQHKLTDTKSEITAVDEGTDTTDTKNCNVALKKSEDKKKVIPEKNNNDKKNQRIREIEYRIPYTASFMGKDKNHNRYWYLKYDGRLFVESPDSKLWGYYSSNKELRALICSLNPKGERERALKSRLECRSLAIRVTIYKRWKYLTKKAAMAWLGRSTHARAIPRDIKYRHFCSHISNSFKKLSLG